MIETQGVPTITFCTQPFRTLATVRKETLGLPDLPIIYLPHPMMTKTREEIDRLADEALAEVVRRLTETAS